MNCLVLFVAWSWVSWIYEALYTDAESSPVSSPFPSKSLNNLMIEYNFVHQYRILELESMPRVGCQQCLHFYGGEMKSGGPEVPYLQ